MKRLHVAAAQIRSEETVAGTLRRVERQLALAARVGADVILFSEGCMHGYDYDLTRKRLREAAEPLSGRNCGRVVSMAKKYGVAILIGFFERDGRRFYNSQLVARPDGSRAVQRKHCLTGGETGPGLVPGPAERTVFEFNGVRTAIIICADGGIKDLHETLRCQGVEYRFCPTGGGGKMDEMLHEADLLTAEGRRAYAKNRPRVFNTKAILPRKECPYTGFAAANALGPAGRRTCHQGHCMIVDNHRVMRAQHPGTIVLEHQQDQMIHAELTF